VPIPGCGDSRELWDITLDNLKLKMTKATFETWLRGTWIAGYQEAASDAQGEERIVVGVPNGYVADWLANRFTQLITRTLGEVIGRSVQVAFEVGHR
jgi:chromosomal replication initiation ATPase DnaA